MLSGRATKVSRLLTERRLKGDRWIIFFVTRMAKNMKEDKNRDAVDTELKELEDDQEVTKFAKKFIAEHKKAFDVLKDK